MNGRSYVVAAVVIAMSQAFAPNSASASVITYDFQADFSSAGLDLGGAGFSTANPLTGSFSFDDTTADTNGSASIGDYTGAITSINFSDASTTVTGSSTGGDVSIVNGPTDSFSVMAAPGNGLIGSNGGATGYTLDGFSLILGDNSGTVFSSDALPASLSLADFPDIRSISLAYLAGDGFTINNAIYNITSLSLQNGSSPVPEPPTILLIGLPLAGLAYKLRKVG